MPDFCKDVNIFISVFPSLSLRFVGLIRFRKGGHEEGKTVFVATLDFHPFYFFLLMFFILLHNNSTINLKLSKTLKSLFYFHCKNYKKMRSNMR